MTASLLDLVVHYQRKVERNNDEEKILHCFSKLNKLPITVEVLSQTGVGKTVNAFRRDPGQVGETSRNLVSKWKRIFEENEQREKLLKAKRAAERAAERDKNHRRERSHEREPQRSRDSSVERSASPAGSEDSENGMEIDEARALEEQRERERAEAEAEAARQAEAAERRAKEEEKRRRREERARREAAKDGVLVKEEPRIKEEPRVKEEPRHHSSKERHSDGDRDRQRQEGKHRRHERPAENGHCSEPPTATVKEERTEARTNGRAEDDRSHQRSGSKHSSSADKHSSRSSEHRSSSREKHHSSSEKHHSSSDKHHSSSEKHSSSSEKHSSKDRSRGDDSSSSKSHHKSRSNGALDAGHSSSSSSKKSSHADGENDASREARRSKHKSKHDKHEKRSGKSAKKEGKEPAGLREVDFLCQPGGNDSDDDQGASFGDALGGPDSVKKKKKKKSKSSSSSHASSASSAHASAPAMEPPRPPPPPPPPPAMEVLDALPEISAHYRPLPRPTAPAATARPAGKRAQDEEEALTAVLNAKNKRTKVYSGARSVGLSRVPTLIDICLKSLSENIDYLEYTGGVPYEILRPVLEKCTAEQLRDIEYYNPYLMEDTDDLWQALIKKDFKCERREEMETWREMHTRCTEERQQKYDKLRSMIEGKRKESLATSRKTKVAYEHTVAKPPRNIARKQAKNGTAVAASMAAPTVMAGGGSRPPRPIPGADPTSRPAAPGRTAAPAKKKAPLMAKVLRAMGRR